MRKLVALLVTLFVLGCGGDSPTEPTRPDLTGSWFGAYESEGLVLNMRWTLADLDPTITGTGSWGVGNLGFIINITGSHQEPNVTLTIIATVGGTPLTYQGTTQRENTINGTLTTASGQNTLQMRRQIIQAAG